MLAIVGCGNTNREDDGVGVYVAQRLLELQTERAWGGVTVYDAGTSGMDVMFKARGCESLIVIDANKSGSEPGTIFEVPGSELENVPEPSYNLHDFRWDHALYAGKKIYKEEFPEDVVAYLIEVNRTAMGVGLSPEVQKSGDRVVEKIIQKIDESISVG